MINIYIYAIIVMGFGVIATSVHAAEPIIFVKEDGTVSVHCSIAAGKGIATFKKLFGEEATVHGDCNGPSLTGPIKLGGNGNGTDPVPIPRGGGGGVAPVCSCPESMVAELYESLRILEPREGFLPTALTWQNPTLRKDPLVFSSIESIQTVPVGTLGLEGYNLNDLKLGETINEQIYDWTNHGNVVKNHGSVGRSISPWASQGIDGFGGLNAPTFRP